MKKYVKPTLDAIELRLEERVARCYTEPKPPNSNGIDNPGDNPGIPENCPSAS